MRHTYIIARYGVNGGTGTLSIRMTKWLVANGYKVIYMCCVNDNTSNSKELIKNGAEFLLINDISYVEHCREYLNDTHQYSVITYSLEEYLSFVNIQHLYINFQRIFLYVVHSLIFGEENNNISFIKRISRRFQLREYIQKIYQNGNLLFMDEMSLLTAQRIFGVIFHEPENSILYIPIEIKNFQIDLKNKSISEDKEIKILTVTRMDFPFKGYVFGLIDMYIELKNKFPYIKLVIIGDGPGLSQLVNKINSLEIQLRAGIELVLHVPYALLDKYFQSSVVYIGMGTTILDAVNNSVPSIIVGAYTYDLSNVRYFNEKRGDIGTVANSELNRKDCSFFVENILNMNFEEYHHFAHLQYCGLKANFDINDFFDVYKNLLLRFKIIILPQFIYLIKILFIRISLLYSKNFIQMK